MEFSSEIKYLIGEEEKTASLNSVDFQIDPISTTPSGQVEVTLTFEVNQEHAEDQNRSVFIDGFFLIIDGKGDDTEIIWVRPKIYDVLPGSGKTRKMIIVKWVLEIQSISARLPRYYDIAPAYGQKSDQGNSILLATSKKLQITNSLHEVLGKATDDIANVLEKIGTNIANASNSTLKTRLQPVGATGTPDLAFWVVIKKATEELSFSNYSKYMDAIFCGDNDYNTSHQLNKVRSLNNQRSLPFINVNSYRSIKIATEAFVMVNYMIENDFTREQAHDLLSRVPITDGDFDDGKLEEWWQEYKVTVNLGRNSEENGRAQLDVIPYLAVIRNKLKDEGIKDSTFESAFEYYLGDIDGEVQQADTCYGIIRQKLAYPSFLELIWSYWHEESMMVQGLSAISRRFQNIRNPGGKDPLAGLNIDPLRPLSNLLWGYIQDEQHRLTVLRRAYEYDHHYGISLEGAAVKNMQAADSRSKFIEAFHRLLHITSNFYKDSDDMTKRPDAFPVLNALKEVHMILSEGAHNQYGDLPSVARTEMLMQQWLLARPEFREFLPTRIMVAYPEPWMDRVAALNKLLGWTETSPLHFRDLGRFGEQILLSVRFGNWSDLNNRDAAFNWANFWREQIQGYIHAYRATTGIDLTMVVVGNKIDARPPSYHLANRLKARQNGQMAKPSSNGARSKKKGVNKEWL